MIGDKNWRIKLEEINRRKKPAKKIDKKRIRIHGSNKAPLYSSIHFKKLLF